MIRSNLTDLARRTLNMIARATIREVNDEHDMQEVKYADVLHSETPSNFERWQPLGFSSVPLKQDKDQQQQQNQSQQSSGSGGGGDIGEPNQAGEWNHNQPKGKCAEAVMVYPNGHRSHPIALCIDDRRVRPHSVPPGGTINYPGDGNGSAWFHHPKKGSYHIVTNNPSYNPETGKHDGQEVKRSAVSRHVKKKIQPRKSSSQSGQQSGGQQTSQQSSQQQAYKHEGDHVNSEGEHHENGFNRNVDYDEGDNPQKKTVYSYKVKEKEHRWDVNGEGKTVQIADISKHQFDSDNHYSSARQKHIIQGGTVTSAATGKNVVFGQTVHLHNPISEPIKLGHLDPETATALAGQLHPDVVTKAHRLGAAAETDMTMTVSYSSDTPPNNSDLGIPFNGFRWIDTTSGIEYSWYEGIWAEGGGAISFPVAPNVDDLYTVGDRQWKWNGIGWQAVPILATQAEAEDGTENTKVMTSLRVAQAIVAQVPGGSPTVATQEEAEAGTENTRMMTPLRVAQAIDVQAPGGIPTIATQAEAEAGTENTHMMTPLRVAQAIDVQAPGGSPTIATQPEAEAGTENTHMMTPLRVAQAIDVQAPPEVVASQAEAEAGTENTKMMTALRVAQAIDVQAPGGSPTIATQAEAEAGVENTHMMTPLRVAQAIDVQAPGGSPTIATQAEAEAGTENTHMMTPLRTANAIDYRRPYASQAEAEAGTENTKVITALRAANAIDYRRPYASQVEAEAGSENTKVMTALRVAQAIDAQAPASPTIATQAEAEAGSDNTKMITPLRAANEIDYRRPYASQAEAEAGSENTKVMTALRVAQAIDAQAPASGGGFISRTVQRADTTITIPTGATKGYVRMTGGGGANKGGGGGYLEKWLTGLTAGLTLSYTNGDGGVNNGANGTASTLASGTQSISTLTANGGTNNEGAGGTATGGDVNISGGSASGMIFGQSNPLSTITNNAAGNGFGGGGGNGYNGADGGIIIDWWG